MELVSAISLFFFFVLCLTRPELAYSTPAKIGHGYRLVSISESPEGGLVGLLEMKEKNDIYGPDIPHLQFSVKHETNERLRVHITDAYHQRWEVPYNLLPRYPPPQPGNPTRFPLTTSDHDSSELIFSFIPDPFGFSVTRRCTGETLFNSSSEESDPFGNLVFKDQYLEISTKLPKDASLYGLGENTQPHGIKLNPNDPYTLYTTDISAITLNTDLYGSHPVYMDLRNQNGSGYAHAVLLLNSNGMDVFYERGFLTYKVIGGVFDFYFFSGPDPLDVVNQYTEFIGRPAAMPYWAFGFHQCRWGYHNLSVVEDVVENYKKAKIPLDVIWNDDDHMDGHKDFTLNPVNFSREKLLPFLEKIHSIGMKYVVIIDPGIAVNKSYGVYQRGVQNDVFIKYNGYPYLAQVWPGAVNFPDFLNPRTVSWWADEVRRFHDLVPVDGLWIDMNEASNFCTGLCNLPVGRICPNGTGPGWMCCLDCKNITGTKWDDPPYKINASGIRAPIGYKTIATSAVHYKGVLEYDAHSLYGFSQSIATHGALQKLEGKRPFVLSRSTFVGSGKYAAHWTGDNQGTWNDLKYSISTMLNFGLFGVPMVGSDICGFYPQPTEELCNRWIELGAFYPFSRDHANYYSPRQELYVWESVAKSARNALGMRYKLLPYLYTLNYEAHASGSPIARPLFFSFPDLPQTYGISTQFLLGSSLMVSPVLEEGETKVNAFFPAGSWYNMFRIGEVVVAKEAKYVTLDAPLNVINLHLYQGAIIPMQQGGLTSKEARTTPFSLVVAFPAGADEGVAKGSLFLDDDELPVMALGHGKSSFVQFYGNMSSGYVKIWSRVSEGEFALKKGWFIEKVTTLGVTGGVEEFALDVTGSPVVDVSDLQVNVGDEKAGVGTMVVALHGLRIPLGKEFSLSWKFAVGK